MKDTVKKWLTEGSVDIFLGYKMVEGHPIPHGFNRDSLDEIDEMVAGPARYPLEKFAAQLLQMHPDAKIGILARDCTQRALNALTVWQQISPGRIKTIQVNCCPSPLGSNTNCSYLQAAETGAYKAAHGVDGSQSLQAMEQMPEQERFDRWMYEFQKCIKCYGCRNVCPMCFCRECSLENTDLAGKGHLPPDIPIFHLVRAVHMAGRCIDCGLCEEACPAEIPLRMLYRKINDMMGNLFDYHTGSSPDQSPFSLLGDKPSTELPPMRAEIMENE